MAHFSAPENEARRRERRPPCLDIRANYVEAVHTRTQIRVNLKCVYVRAGKICGSVHG